MRTTETAHLLEAVAFSRFHRVVGLVARNAGHAVCAHLRGDHATAKRIFRRAVLLTLLASMLPLAPRIAAAERRGAVAFHYGPTLTARQLEWFGRFDVLVTHEPLPQKQVAQLHACGTRLALYEWSVAYYATRARALPVLNRKPLRGGVGAADLDAFYYDPAAPSFDRLRSRDLAKRLRAIGYDGVFFDTTTEQSVHPEALAQYRRLHPEIPYDHAFSRFLAALRKELPKGLILTNQGYRAAEHYLPHVDYDITESLFTFPVGDGFQLRTRDEIADLMDQWILPAAGRHPAVRFLHLNYLAQPNEKVIAEIVRLARSHGQEAYVGLPDVTRTAFSDVYFEEPPPSGNSPR